MPHESAPSTSLVGPLSLTFLSRLIANVMLRFPYTYLVSISAGLGISPSTATQLLGVRELGGLGSPLVGAYADRGHERRAIVAAAAVSGISMVAVGLAPPLPLLALILMVSGFAKFGLNVAQNAWISHRVPFSRRAATLGLIESSWALALLGGIPLCGWIDQQLGWRWMFIVTGVALCIAALVMLVVIPPDQPEEAGPKTRPSINRNSVAMYGYALAQPFAQMMLFAVYGLWFQRGLGMSTALLAGTSTIIGLGELTGTVSTSLIADRIGKRRSAIIGLLVAAPLAAAAGAITDQRWIAVALVALCAVGLEFSFVSSLPIMTELDPHARAASIGRITALITIARAVASAIAGLTYEWFGITGSGFACAGCCVIGIGALWLVTEPR